MATKETICRLVYAPTNTLLTLDKGASTGEPQYIVGRPDDQDPSVNAAQQWVLTAYRESMTYTIRNVAQGLYAAPIYQGDANTVLSGVTRPFHWTIEPEDGADTICISVPSTNRILTILNYAKTPGAKACLVPRNASIPPNPAPTATQRTWVVRVVKKPATKQPPPLIATLPTIRPGLYRIRCGDSRRGVLTQMTSTVTSSRDCFQVVGLPEDPTNDLQLWSVILYESSQTYFIQNHSTGLWLGVPSPADVGAEVLSHPRERLPLHWDIRQGEFEGHFVVHFPGLSWVMSSRSSRGTVPSRIIMTRKEGQPGNADASWRFEPVRSQAQRLHQSLQPSVYLAPLKTGPYFIRNANSRTLLTQSLDADIATGGNLNPNVVGAPYKSENERQMWMVSFIPYLKAYLVRNLGSGRYLTSEYDASNGGLIQASQLPRIWAIKQSEASEEFLMQLVGSTSTITLFNGRKEEDTKVYISAKTGQPTIGNQRWLFEPIADRQAHEDPNDYTPLNPLPSSEHIISNPGPTRNPDPGPSPNDPQHIRGSDPSASTTPAITDPEKVAPFSTNDDWKVITSPTSPGELSIFNPTTGMYLTPALILSKKESALKFALGTDGSNLVKIDTIMASSNAEENVTEGQPHILLQHQG